MLTHKPKISTSKERAGFYGGVTTASGHVYWCTAAQTTRGKARAAAARWLCERPNLADHLLK